MFRMLLAVPRCQIQSLLILWQSYLISTIADYGEKHYSFFASMSSQL